MGIKWKNHVKKWIAQGLLGAMLVIPAVSSADELQGILEREAMQVQEDAAEGQNEDEDHNGGDCQGSGGTAEAEGEQPGGEGDDGAGIMPCVDWDEKFKGSDSDVSS